MTTTLYSPTIGEVTAAVAEATLAIHTGHLPGRTIEVLLADRDRLQRRLDAVCPDHQRCAACGTALCDDCGVGDPSSCDHVLEPLCVGCDVEYCATCCAEAGIEDHHTASEGSWS